MVINNSMKEGAKLSESKQDQEPWKWKENKCKIQFYCDHSKHDPCVYFSFASNPDRCKHAKTMHYLCTSTTAMIVRMGWELDKLKRNN